MSVACVLLVLLQVTFSLSAYPACYPDKTQCHDSLKKLLVDDDVFWYGTDFLTTCPPSLKTPDCLNNPSKSQHNIISRMYNLTDSVNASTYVHDDIKLIDVTFNSPQGSYYACGHMWESMAVTNYMVDPTHVMTIGQYAMDHLPTISWDTSKDPANTLYTLVVWDSGFWYAHGIYINIPGGDFKSGQAVIPFFGPKVPVLRPNVYVVSVFRQTASITTQQATKATNFVFGALQGTMPLLSWLDMLPINKELVASNIMVVPGDAYGLQYQVDAYVINKCPTLISQAPALKKHLDAANVQVEWTQDSSKLHNDAKPYINSLSVNLKIVHTLPDDVHVESCCSNYMYMRSKMIVDPLSDESVRAVRAKKMPHVKMTPVNILGDRYDSFKSKIYTLMMVDIVPQTHGGANFAIHWMVNNIVGGNVDNGRESLPYVGPSPYERTKPHTYIFLLFEQSTAMAEIDIPKWRRFTVSEGCPAFLSLRCGNKLGTLLSEYGLTTLRGVSWFTAAQDGYIRKRLYSDYMVFPKQQVCRGVNGYEDPCPKDNYTGSGSLTVYGTGVLLVSTLMAIFTRF